MPKSRLISFLFLKFVKLKITDNEFAVIFNAIAHINKAKTINSTHTTTSGIGDRVQARVFDSGSELKYCLYKIQEIKKGDEISAELALIFPDEKPENLERLARKFFYDHIFPVSVKKQLKHVLLRNIGKDGTVNTKSDFIKDFFKPFYHSLVQGFLPYYKGNRRSAEDMARYFILGFMINVVKCKDIQLLNDYERKAIEDSFREFNVQISAVSETASAVDSLERDRYSILTPYSKAPDEGSCIKHESRPRPSLRTTVVLSVTAPRKALTSSFGSATQLRVSSLGCPPTVLIETPQTSEGSEVISGRLEPLSPSHI